MRKAFAGRCCKLGMVGWIIICVLIGGGLGLALSGSSATAEWGIWLGMPGKLYIRALTLLIAPLVFGSVVLGVTSLEEIGVSTGRTGGLTASMYVITTVVAACEGLAMTYALYPLWHRTASLAVLATPRSLPYASTMSVLLTNAAAPTGAYYNSTSVASVRLVLSGKEWPLTVAATRLSFLFPKAVGLDIDPVEALGPHGPYLGPVTNVTGGP